jgi:pimeloyl-ACP methyl ester carboxylesterase
MNRPTTRYLRDGDVHIAWQEVGSGGADLLVTPGFISHLDLNWTLPSFADFIDHLTGFARVILFDKRGTGLSDHGPDADRFERRMQDIELVLDAAGSDRATILGLSEGGPLACLFAATRPDRVESLALCGTFARGSAIDHGVIERFENAVDHWGEGLTAGIFLSGSDGPIARRFVSLFERAAAGPGMARRLLRSIAECDVSDILPAIDAPTVVLHRRHDPFARAEWSDELAALIPGAVRVELSGQDHLPWMGDSQDVVSALGKWMTGRPPHEGTSDRRRRFAAIVFTDIVDSTSRLALAGDEAWALTVQHHNNTCRRVFETYDGWSVKSTGDGFIACFDTPDAAARCIIDLHRDLADLGIEIRAGLHCGEIERIDLDDVAGMTVNIAARWPRPTTWSSSAVDSAVE